MGYSIKLQCEKFKSCVLIEAVISRCVSIAVFYSSGAMEGLTAAVTGVEENTDISIDTSRCCARVSKKSLE